MKEKLTHNLGLKILAVVLAVFTWLIMVNVSNPMMTATQTVPVEMINANVLEDARMTYELVGKDSVTVSYRVHIRDRSRVNSGDFYAYADLAQLYDVTGAVPVQVEITDPAVRQILSSESLTISPFAVRIQTEPIQTKSFELSPRIIGEPENGFALGEISLSPSAVYVTGAESVIGQISSAGVEIDADGISEDISGQAEVNFYDANDHRLELDDEKVSLRTSAVDYDVSVLEVKELPLDLQAQGSAASGYRFTGATSDVRTVTLAGPSSVLGGMSSLIISGEELSVDQAVRDVTVTIDVRDYLPPGVSLAGEGSGEIEVTLIVQPLELRTVTYDVGQIDMLGLSGNYRYAFDEQELELRIRGLREELDRLENRDINAAMDLHGLGPGEHQVELTVNLPEGFEFVGPASVNIRIEESARTADSDSQEDRHPEDRNSGGETESAEDTRDGS